MNRKICIITGANSGIGQQAAIQIAEQGFHVIMACRSRDRGQTALDEILKTNPALSLELRTVDMGLQSSIRAFAEDFKRDYVSLDVLIHNAAIFNITQKERELTAEGVESIWAANHLGPVLMTELLLENLLKSKNGRVLTVSSRGLQAKPFLKVDLNDPEFSSRKFSIVNAYYQSKLAQVMYSWWMADRLKDTRVTVNSIRVTAVKVDISRHPELSPFMKWVYMQKAKKSITPKQMARTYTHLAVSDQAADSNGSYFDENNKKVDSGKYSHDKENIRAVMKLTAAYIDELKRIV